MNKLVSKNPIQRFKQGKKIVKAEEGAVARWQRRIKSGINGIGSAFKGAFDMTFNPNNTQFGSQKIYNFSRTVPSRIINSLVVDNYTPENGGITNNRIRKQRQSQQQQTTTTGTSSNNNQYASKVHTTQLTPDKITNSRDAMKYIYYFQQGNLPAKQKYGQSSITNPVTTTNKQINNYYLKGFENRKTELAQQGKTVRDIQKMLGFTGKGLDGKWGDNTERAYKQYLALKNVPTYEKPEMPSVAEMAGIYSQENKPLYQQIRFKQGGQLVSRNPITRFKNKKK